MARRYAPAVGDGAVEVEGDAGAGAAARSTGVGWSSVVLVAVTVAGVVMRFWDLGSPSSLFPDETYSAVTASLPWSELWSHVRATDPHPPLSYLILKPLESLTTNEAWLRVPSSVAAAAALVVFAWWQRRRSVEGIVAVALFALSPLALFYGHQARMYGLMQLAGVVGAFAAARWRAQASRALATVAAVAGLVASLSHATGFLLPIGLLLVAGLRRDRAANEWRLAQALSLVVYGVLWGPAAAGWRGSSLYAPLSLSNWTITVNELVAPIPDNRIVVLPLLLAGAVVIATRRTADDVAWLSLVLAPLGIATVLAFHTALFIPKTFVVVAWGPPMALAAFAAAVWQWRAPIGGLVIALTVLLLVAAVPHTFESFGNAEPIASRLEALVQDGDVVVSHPPGDMVPWYAGISRTSSPGPGLGLSDTYEIKVGTAPWTGRVWVVDALYLEPPLAVDGPSCAPTEHPSSSWQIRCVELGPAR